MDFQVSNINQPFKEKTSVFYCIFINTNYIKQFKYSQLWKSWSPTFGSRLSLWSNSSCLFQHLVLHIITLAWDLILSSLLDTEAIVTNSYVTTHIQVKTPLQSLYCNMNVVGLSLMSMYRNMLGILFSVGITKSLTLANLT